MNKKELGEHRRKRALELLARTGYASTRQIALFLHGSCTESTRRMTRNTMLWLAKNKLVVSRREGTGIINVNTELMFALNAAGVSAARDLGIEPPGGKLHARDYLRHAHSHRTACNSVFANLAASGLECWSELEIQNEKAPLKRYEFWSSDGERLGKIPDLLVRLPQGLAWIEVENAWRSEKDLQKMADAMRSLFEKEIAESFFFYVTNPGGLKIGQRLIQKLTHGPDSGWAASVRMLDERLKSRIAVAVVDPETLLFKSVHLGEISSFS